MLKTAHVVLLTLFLGIGTYSKADHTLPQGSLKRLSDDSRYLYYVVRNSSLHSGVKRAVNDFTYKVDSMIRCAQSPDSRENTRDHDLLPEHCEHYLNYVHYSWYNVERYLWDTAYDYPYVYRAYLRVRTDMRDLPH